MHAEKQNFENIFVKVLVKLVNNVPDFPLHKIFIDVSHMVFLSALSIGPIYHKSQNEKAPPMGLEEESKLLLRIRSKWLIFSFNNIIQNFINPKQFFFYDSVQI